MSIATTTQFWTTRWNGGDPAQASSYGGQDNEVFTMVAGSNAGYGSDADGSWKITVPYSANPALVGWQQWTNVPSNEDYTVVMCIHYPVADKIMAEDKEILFVANSTHRIQIQSNGTADKLKIVHGDGSGGAGASTTTLITGLDLTLAGGFEAKPLILRLTLNSAGKAKIYINEIIEDDLGTSKVIEVDAIVGSAVKAIRWGNGQGNDSSITFHNLYVSTHGAFSPDEMSTSPFVTDSLMRMAFSIRDLLRNSKRMYLKNFVDDSSIVYGYDVSSGMVSRLAPPTIHIVLRELTSPDFETLGGTRIDQNYTITLFVTTRGTDYKNAYRMGMEIGGDAFDEIYTNTGLEGNTDSLINYSASFDTKMDDDEVVCIHRFEYQYMRRLNMLHR
jgi:hypothetical protein|tara:strand:+ start:753 stop:1919 length:1167 start_codon:yes stop_codon:yes gene_type:complete